MSLVVSAFYQKILPCYAVASENVFQKALETVEQTQIAAWLDILVQQRFYFLVSPSTVLELNSRTMFHATELWWFPEEPLLIVFRLTEAYCAAPSFLKRSSITSSFETNCHNWSSFWAYGLLDLICHSRAPARVGNCLKLALGKLEN